MEVIDQLVTPPSANHILLLKYILIIALVIFIPYMCMLMGASAISLFFGYRGKRILSKQKPELSSTYARFSKDVIERLTITKNAELALGIIPILSILFSYAQLLYAAKTITIGMMALSAILFIAALILVYRYRTSFRIESVLNTYKSLVSSASEKAHREKKEELKEFEDNVTKAKNTSGITGTLLLYTAAYLFVGSMQLASDPHRWGEINNMLALLFSWTTFSNFLSLLAASGLITGGAILFYFFKWPSVTAGKEGGIEGIHEAEQTEYSKFVKKFAASLAFVSGILLPILLFYNFIYLPQAALSPSVFVYMLLALVTILVLCNFLYFVIKNQEIKFASLVFILILFAFMLNIIKDQVAFGNAITEQALLITQKAEELEKEKKNKVLTTAGISGEEVYKVKCVSCHKFDTRLVGPPHDQVVPKYGGDVQKLANYIQNPTKIDAGYPPMPNPGLKPKEAIAVAQYLIEKVKKDTGK